MKRHVQLAVMLLFLIQNCYFAQSINSEVLKPVNSTSIVTDEAVSEVVPLIKKIRVNALLIGDYGASLTKNVDINGKHYAEGAPSSDGFYLRYVRFQANMDLTQNISAQVLVNLADFKEDPQTKVLEIATVKYKFNNYANFQIGQFRPYFGLEDRYSSDIHKSYTWSNQYSLFGKNHWQSFQLGAALFGSLEDNKIPLKYFYTFSNANGKNQKGDSDNYKTHSFRVEYAPVKGISLGTNVAFGGVKGETTNAYGADFNIEKKINNKWYLGLDGEYKQGSNILAFKASTITDKRANDYRMQGVYVTPLIRMYTGNQTFFDAVEFSCRYEYLEELIENGNPSRTYTPMISIIMGETYQSKVSLVGNLTTYNTQIPNSTQWDNNQFLVQYQFRY